MNVARAPRDFGPAHASNEGASVAPHQQALSARSARCDTSRSVLVIDDDDDLRALLALRLAAHGYSVDGAATAAEGLRRIGGATLDAVLLDLRLPDADGIAVLSEVRERAPDLPVIVLSAHGSIDLAVEATRRGAFGFVTKPFHDHDLLLKLEQAVETAALRREVAGLRTMVGRPHPEHLVGTSTAIAAVRDAIARVARSDVTVLLMGESGTGKELAARSLHAQSPRAHGPFVAVNCAALPAELLESELFGSVGARDREGVFAAAAGGTLLLDEVGDASPNVQAKLLRVLQERTYTPVGSTREVPSDVRIVAATHRDLRADAASGRFREDLLFRLHVVPIRIPPLRERQEDVPFLAELFLERAAARHGRRAPRLAPDAMRALLEHRWPGNVRELANVVEAALLLATDDVLRADQLASIMVPLSGRDRDADWLSCAVAASIDRERFPTLKAARDALDATYLAELLRRAGGNVSAAARLAGRTRSDLYELLRRHGLTSAPFRAQAASNARARSSSE